jgi:hypothetical protein
MSHRKHTGPPGARMFTQPSPDMLYSHTTTQYLPGERKKGEKDANSEKPSRKKQSLEGKLLCNSPTASAGSGCPSCHVLGRRQNIQSCSIIANTSKKKQRSRQGTSPSRHRLMIPNPLRCMNISVSATPRLEGRGLVQTGPDADQSPEQSGAVHEERSSSHGRVASQPCPLEVCC